MINRCLREFLIARRRLQVVCTLKMIKKYCHLLNFEYQIILQVYVCKFTKCKIRDALFAVVESACFVECPVSRFKAHYLENQITVDEEIIPIASF